jgi:hypothetical protein
MHSPTLDELHFMVPKSGSEQKGCSEGRRWRFAPLQSGELGNGAEPQGREDLVLVFEPQAERQ